MLHPLSWGLNILLSIQHLIAHTLSRGQQESCMLLSAVEGLGFWRWHSALCHVNIKHNGGTRISFIFSSRLGTAILPSLQMDGEVFLCLINIKKAYGSTDIINLGNKRSYISASRNFRFIFRGNCHRYPIDRCLLGSRAALDAVEE